MEAMVHAVIQAESYQGAATLSNEWQSTLDDMFVCPSFPSDDMDGNGRAKARPNREGNQTNVHRKEKVHGESMIYSKKNLKPVKTIPCLRRSSLKVLT